MKTLPIIYLGYMFVSIYFITFYILLYKKNRKTLFEFPEITKKYSISVLIPAWNEEKTIANTIKAVASSEYKIKEIIVLNDGSTDKTREIVEKLLSEYENLKLINKENSGKADSLNHGLKIAKGDLVAVVDADSYPAKDSFAKMVGFFDDKEVGASTCFIVSRNKNKFIEKLQTYEYNIIAFTRKLLEYVDAIYVTPGPLALYRKSALKEIKGFDKTSLTEDIEVTWHLIAKGYKRKMTLATNVTTTVPDNMKEWYSQRKRWSYGGIQCIFKYRKYFMKRGMLGYFIWPFFVVQTFLGLLGLGIFAYVMFSRIATNFLFVGHSIQVGTPVLTSTTLMITPSFLNYLGLILILLGGTFTYLILSLMKENILEKRNAFNLLFYLLFYISSYPVITLMAWGNYLRKNKKWR